MLFGAVSILTLLGAISLTVCDTADRNDVYTESLLKSNGDFTLVNPRQVVQLERTIKLLLARLAEPVRQPVALRSRSPNDTALQRTISEISWSIRKKLREFAGACGLHRTAKTPEQFPANLTKDWFSETLLQGSLVLTDLGIIADQLYTSTDRYFRQRNIILIQKNKDVSISLRKNGVQFLGAVDDFTEYSNKLTNCLKYIAQKSSTTSGFNLNNVAFDLLRNPPRNLTRTLKNKSSNDLPSKSVSFNPSHMFICSSLITNGDQYLDCIEQIKEFNECLSESNYGPIEPAITSNNFDKQDIKLIRNLLKHCKVGLSKEERLSIRCKLKKNMPANMGQRVRYIYERMLNEKVPEGSSLYRAANQLGDVLLKSDLGTKFATELWQHLAVYEEGEKKLKALSKIGKPKAVARYRKVSKALELYKKALLSRTIDSIGKVHKTVNDLEKLLARNVRANLSDGWFGHVGILTCLANWMATVIQLLFGKNKGTFTTTTMAPDSLDSPSSERIPTSSTNSSETRMYHISIPRSKTVERTELVDKSMKNLIRSMRQVSKYRSANERSTLASLANNLLLVAMFIETIGFISTLFYVGKDQQDQANSAEMYNSWRNRRNPDINPLELEHLLFDMNVPINYYMDNDSQAYDEQIPYPELTDEDPTIPAIANWMK